MRRSEFAMPPEAAIAFLAQAPFIHLGGADAAGNPMLKTVDHVVVGERVYFHSSPAGEKTALLDRPVVVSAEEKIAFLPSTFLGGTAACAASTLYRSVQVHGVLEPVTSPPDKARILAALMARLQPEGGYRPIEPGEPGYMGELRGVLVAGVSLARIDGKAKLAQNRSPEERLRLLEALWARGDAGDPRAIELIRQASPALPPPSFLAPPRPGALHPWLPPARAQAAAELVVDEYWNTGRYPPEVVRDAHLGPNPWVGATDEGGRLIATARAISDQAKQAWIYDVGVAPEHRGQGWGTAVVRLLLDHPALRRCHRVLLATRDAQAFYAQLGFAPRQGAEPPRTFHSEELLLFRG